MKTRVSLKYFVNDCSYGSELRKRNTLSTLFRYLEKGEILEVVLSGSGTNDLPGGRKDLPRGLVVRENSTD